LTACAHLDLLVIDGEKRKRNGGQITQPAIGRKFPGLLAENRLRQQTRYRDQQPKHHLCFFHHVIARQPDKNNG